MNSAIPDPSDEEASELLLRPASGLSPSQRELIAKTYEPVTDQTETKPSGFRFSIGGLLLITAAIAIGLSGSNWTSPRIFAGIMAILANLVVFTIELHGVDEPRIKWIAAVFCIACAAAIVTALLL